MSSRKKTTLEMTVAAVQLRWGPRALRRLGKDAARPEVPHIPTGFTSLDNALGIGGIPRGRITEILGVPTSGMTTLALKILANAQSVGDTAVYVDLAHTFDPDYAGRCGVNVKRLLLARPHDSRQALDIVYTLVTRGGVGVLLFDAVTDLFMVARGAWRPINVLQRLVATLAQSPTVLLFLTPLLFGDATSGEHYPDGFALPHVAAVRLLLERQQWIRRRQDVRGYRAQVTVLKNRLGASGKRVTIAITFNGTVQGDAT